MVNETEKKKTIEKLWGFLEKNKIMELGYIRDNVYFNEMADPEICQGIFTRLNFRDDIGRGVTLSEKEEKNIQWEIISFCARNKINGLLFICDQYFGDRSQANKRGYRLVDIQFEPDNESYQNWLGIEI